jgi:predicted dinucleotide-binding enzyme
MRIGILGSGLMGGKLGALFARAGHDVVFSYSHTQSKLEALAREAGKRAQSGTPREAARDADVVLLAVHWSRVDDVLEQAGDLRGKVIVSCSLPMNRNDTALVVAHTSSGAEELAKKARRTAGGRALLRALHAADREARLRRRRRARARVPVRALRGAKLTAAVLASPFNVARR